MLFTMEQIELIRRLRTTGISSDQILKAFGDLDVSQSPQNNNKMSSVFTPLLVQQLSAPPSTPSISPQLAPPLTPKENITVQTVPVSVKSENLSPSPSSIFEHPICSSAPRPIRSQRTPMKEITTLDDPNELEEFMRQGEEACILDMKTFITQYSLRQTTVAMMTGVSQPYISKLLNGNHRELSLRCRKNIYCWYLNCRRHPAKLASFLADPSTRLETNGDGELVPQRRERYVFRPILIRMLESFFAHTPFPDLPRRVEIATACNHMLQLDKKGLSLMPKEIVSPQVVSNWFANKRKELRRRSAEATAASSSSASSSSSTSSLNNANNDTASVSSMSPPSRDEEAISRNTTPETVSPALFDSVPPVSSSSSSSSASATIPLSLPSLIPAPGSPLELLAMAQRLGLQLPLLDTSTTPFPSIHSSFLPFQLPTAALPFYSSPAP